MTNYLTCNYCGLDIDTDQESYVITVANAYHDRCVGALMPTTPRIYIAPGFDTTTDTQPEYDTWTIGEISADQITAGTLTLDSMTFADDYTADQINAALEAQQETEFEEISRQDELCCSYKDFLNQHNSPDHISSDECPVCNGEL